MGIPDSCDAVVIGSGIGGLACAAALAKFGHRVVVLESHSVAGGLTHTFTRNGYEFSVGVHYLGDVGPDGDAGGHLNWLSNGAIRMAPMGAVYDTLHFPDEFHLQLSRPEAALRLDIAERFPESKGEIEAYFSAVREALDAARSLYALRAMPEPLARIFRLMKGRKIEKWCARTTAEVVSELVSDPRLRSVLCAQWGDYGGLPRESCFAIHAMVTHDFFNGAYYPIGGSGVFAQALGTTIEAAGGTVQVNARVAEIVLENSRAVGIRLADGRSVRAPHVISDVGVRNTLQRLLPESVRQTSWAQEVLAIRPSIAYIGLYLGLEGDIRAHGATVSNHWFYDTWDVNASVWEDPISQASAPCLCVSFPSLKDPLHEPGPTHKHTAELLAYTRWDAFAPYAAGTDLARQAYQALKARIERSLVEQFAQRFPGLAPMIRHREISTPLTLSSYTGAQHGAMYGLEVTPRRFLCEALNCRTPINGLHLAGQDVGSPGVHGALMGGLMAAASVDTRVFAHVAS